MSKDSQFWKEIDDAVVSGYVYHMEDFFAVYGTPPTRHYGTKIWFTGNVTSIQCEKIARHIRQKYGFRVDYPTAFCLVVWQPTIFKSPQKN